MAQFRGPPLKKLGSSVLCFLVLSVAGAAAQEPDLGLTPLMVAALSGTPEAVAQLLAAGAPVDAASPRGKTALHLAAEFNPNPAVVRTLIKAGASVSARDLRGRTPLMAAALHNTVPVVETLLAAGARPWDQDLKGRTAYQYAAGEVGQPNRRLVAASVVWKLYQNRVPRSLF